MVRCRESPHFLDRTKKTTATLTVAVGLNVKRQTPLIRLVDTRRIDRIETVVGDRNGRLGIEV